MADLYETKARQILKMPNRVTFNKYVKAGKIPVKGKDPIGHNIFDSKKMEELAPLMAKNMKEFGVYFPRKDGMKRKRTSK